MNFESHTSINEDRKTWQYRLAESALGLASLGFLLTMLIISFVQPRASALLLIVYSFLWVLKFSLNAMYTIFTYKQVRRWEQFRWDEFMQLLLSGKRDGAKELLKSFQKKYRSKIDWEANLQKELRQWDANQDTKFANPMDMWHVAIFSIYNESAQVLERSLRSIYTSGYPLDKIFVVITQEARVGQEHIQKVYRDIQEIDWLQLTPLQEDDLDIVYSKEHTTFAYKNKKMAQYQMSSTHLNVFFTQHPDGLVGEIKGKASNEDWGGRQASLLLKSLKIDPETVLVTSLDADSHVGEYFFHNLSYKYVVTPNRRQSGFQPVHVYSNNFFQTGIWQRQVATQNTLTNMMYLTIQEETHFFAIYSTPMSALQEVDFWVREVIGEDYMLYAKCLAHFKGDFEVVPFYGVFEGDAVEADDYIEAIVNQYKQLQRWTWGGVESFPYIFKKFFLEKSGQDIDLRKRIRYVLVPFQEHFFWASTPLLLSIGVALPQIIGGEAFLTRPVAQNLAVFGTYFVWISFVFVGIFSYITFQYIATRAIKNEKRSWYHNLLIAIQWLVMPLIFGFMAIPALDSQIRGIRGKYLGYWVTPKK